MITFGTDGWRAKFADDYTFENVSKVIQAYCDVLAPPPGSLIFLGHDRRLNSRDFAVCAAEVLAGNGIKVLLSKDYCPTPCISWMAKTHEALGGVVITASHNPAEWNGVKFKAANGSSASPEFTSKVERQIAENDRAKKNIRRLPAQEAADRGLLALFDPHEDYVKQLQSFVDLEKIRNANWKIAYDPLYGAGSGFLQKILGVPLREIHAEKDPSFGGLNPEPIDKNLHELMALVPHEKLDVGLATDGDADRIGAVDENGRFVTPHQIFALILNHLIAKGLPGDVVKTVSTTGLIDRIAAKHGRTVHETPIGFKHICGKFQEIIPLIGGEESGGIGLPSHVHERDGLLSGLLLLEIMSVHKKRLGVLLQDLGNEYGPFHFQREDVHLTNEDAVRLRDSLSTLDVSSLNSLKVTAKNRKDGLKFTLEDGSWLLLRLSGTEPLLRVYSEASSLEHARRLIAEGRRILGVA